MNDPFPNSPSLAVEQAARRFTQALAAEAVLHDTVRVEALLRDQGAGPLFLLDRALHAAWPQAAGAPPRHEVIWACEATNEAGLRLSAFDSAGRVLLRRTYATRRGATDAQNDGAE